MFERRVHLVCVVFGTIYSRFSVTVNQPGINYIAKSMWTLDNYTYMCMLNFQNHGH